MIKKRCKAIRFGLAALFRYNVKQKAAPKLQALLFMELLTGFEPVTSSLPRMHSTY